MLLRSRITKKRVCRRESDVEIGSFRLSLRLSPHHRHHRQISLLSFGQRSSSASLPSLKYIPSLTHPSCPHSAASLWPDGFLRASSRSFVPSIPRIFQIFSITRTTHRPSLDTLFHPLLSFLQVPALHHFLDSRQLKLIIPPVPCSDPTASGQRRSRSLRPPSISHVPRTPP